MDLANERRRSFGDTLEFRVRAAENYLAAVANPPWRDWLEGYEQFLRGQLDPRQALALADPDGWPDSTSVAHRRAFLGARFDSHVVITPGMTCESHVLFGAPCPFRRPLQCDHLFPQARGGPTDQANLLMLCDLHNQAKGDDVHLYPWERNDPPEWLGWVLRGIATAA